MLGIAEIVQGSSYLGGSNATTAALAAGLAAIAIGILLLAGFLTPIAAAVAGAGAIGAAMSAFPASAWNLLDSKASLIFALTMLVALIGLGPGAYSVDARVFGRREIIIPPPASGSRE